MTLPDTIKHSGGTSRTTGIASQSISAGANYLGSEIDNSSNLDTEANIEVLITCSTAPTANKTVEIYLLYAIDGTNYEDGGVSVDPTKVPVGIVAARNVTGAQRLTIEGVRLQPYKCKVLLKSELDQTSQTTTVLLYSHNPTVID